MKKNIRNTLFMMSMVSVISACGGGGGESGKDTPTPTPTPTPTNTAPTHDGNIVLSLKESDASVTVNLLKNAQDGENDTLTSVDIVADANNPQLGFSLSASSLTITPSSFVESLADGEQQTIIFDYKISDGSLSTPRKVTITILGESPIVVAPPSSNNVITVDLSSQYYLNNVSRVQRNKFFNLHDNFGNWEYSSALINSYKNNYHVDHGRLFWSPLAVGKQYLLNNGIYPTTSYAQTNGPKNLSNVNNNPNLPLISNRTIITDHPANILAGGNNNDPIDGARWAADYFQYYYDDATRPAFYEPMNEPFIHASEFPEFGNRVDVIKLMTKWFGEIGKAFHARPELKDVAVVGYSSAWPSMELNNFGHWNEKMKYFMDNAGDNIDAFSTHLYDGVNVVGANTQRSGSNAQAVLDMIETYSMIKWNKVKPHVISEYGNIVQRPAGELAYDETVNSQTIKSFNFILHELLKREDRILTSIPFLTGYARHYWQDPAQGNGNPYNPSLWRPNPNNIHLVDAGNGKQKWTFIDETAADNYLLNNNSLFLDFWKDVNGNRVKITKSNPDLLVTSFVNNDKAYVIISNLDDQAQSLQFNLANMPSYQYNSVKIERLTVPKDSGARLTTETQTQVTNIDGSDLAVGNVTLASAESIKYTFTLSKPNEFVHTIQRKTYYSKDYLQPIVANTDLNFPINNVDLTTKNSANSTAKLRLSFSRAHTRSKQPTVKINGTALAVPDNWAGYDQANRDLFFGSIEIPVPFNLLSVNNTVTVSFTDSGDNVSTLVLEVNNEIDPIAVSSVSIGSDILTHVGDSSQLTAAVLPSNANDTSVTWSSSQPSVASVSDTGLVNALTVGTSVITATTTNGLTASITYTVEKVNDNLLANANADFELPLDNSVIIARNSTGQVNLATFEINATAAKDGTGGLMVDNTAGSLKLQFLSSGIIQSVDPTKTYRFSVDVKVISGSHVVWTEIEGGTGGWLQASIPSSTQWQTIFTEYTGAQLGNNFGFNFHIDPTSNGGGGIIYVDNARLSVVP